MSARRGVWLFILFLAVIGVAVLGAAVLLRRPASVPSASVLVFDVPTELNEAEPPARAFPFAFGRANRPLVYDVVDGLMAAADDDRITALVLHIDRVDWGWAKLNEVRDAVLEFRASGKPVYASLSGGGEAEYFLASAADQIAAPPTAILQIDGLTASALFFRGTFEKLDISPNFAQAGRFKTGVEPFTRNEMSPAGRAALESLLDDEFSGLVDSIAYARDLPVDSVHAIIDAGPYRATAALDCGLVDTLLYEADVDSLAHRTGTRRHDSVRLADYIDQIGESMGGSRIALVTAAGTIVSGRSRYTTGDGLVLGSETLSEALRQVRTRRSVKAVVLRIDSPGGELQASDEIWREVQRLRRAKPLVVSMSDLAASGGYYIAAPAHRIVAQPGTITGSIGVFGGKLNVLGLYRKLGLNVETVSRGRHAGMMSPFRDFTEEEARRFQAQMDDGYRLFLARVSEGRGLDPATADSVGQGHVWSGRAAVALGLVDTLGGLPIALDLARELAKIPEGEDVGVEIYPKVERTFFQKLAEQWFDSDDQESDALARLSLPAAFHSWLEGVQRASGSVLALLPYTILIR